MITLHDWRDRERAHRVRVRHLLSGHEDRQQRGVAHPVEDFLFTYYTFRPNQLRRWSPGLGYAILSMDAPHARWQLYRTTPDGMVTVDADLIAERRSVLVQTIRRLLRATTARSPALGCFGMHEWAMVYRLDADDVRHSSWPMRFDAGHIADIVEERGLRCTHFDALRFFTEPARPLNQLSLSREQQIEHEQPGCLHAGMDLYKWAYKLTPAVSSDLVLDALELARDIRYVDMRASPYDLETLGLAPIAVETGQGRAEYVRHQQDFARRAAPIRRQLLEVYEQLAGVTAACSPASARAEPLSRPAP